jgi:hypothetical protein
MHVVGDQRYVSGAVAQIKLKDFDRVQNKLRGACTGRAYLYDMQL